MAYYPIPDAHNLPILLGARMSLSFPVLLSAVPLYAANSTEQSPDGKIRSNDVVLRRRTDQ